MSAEIESSAVRRARLVELCVALKVGPVARAVLQELQRHADGGDVAPTQETIARDTGWTPRSVRNALFELETRGLLRITKLTREHGGLQSRYEIGPFDD